MQRTPAGLPCGIPGIGDDMLGAMQQAAHPGRQLCCVVLLVSDISRKFVKLIKWKDSLTNLYTYLYKLSTLQTFNYKDCCSVHDRSQHLCIAGFADGALHYVAVENDKIGGFANR